MLRILCRRRHPLYLIVVLVSWLGVWMIFSQMEQNMDNEIPPFIDDKQPRETMVRRKQVVEEIKDFQDIGEIPEVPVILRGEFPPEPMPNEPDFELVRKLFNITNAGFGGHAFTIDVKLLPHSEEVKYLKSFKVHAMNEYVSNLIGVRRTLRDARMSRCPRNISIENLPPTSIIICFVNEAWTTLLRTVNSAIDNTPDQLLREIILVDDGSSYDFLHKPLEVYLSRYPKVKLIRAPSAGLGLMRARMLGYEHATGSVITFLDSHCECFPGWLEPQLEPLAKDYKVVTTPNIDVINKDTYAIGVGSAAMVGVVEFPSLAFGWRVQPPREVKRRGDDILVNVRNPAMAGGLFSITRKYFDELGGFDPGMAVWGGENIEMSFKVHMCGGRLESSLCSRVGHVFHNHNSYSSLRLNTGHLVARNSDRVAEVWMDEFKKYYSGYTDDGGKRYNPGDVSDRLKVREAANCKSFQWYIDNIYPEAALPGNGIYSGEIRNSAHSSLCIDLTSQTEGSLVEMYHCHGKGANQLFDMTDLGEVVSLNRCLETRGEATDVYVIKCNWSSKLQLWDYKGEKQIRQNSRCMAVNDAEKLVVEPCEDGKVSQHWKWQYQRSRRPNALRQGEK